jgi:hypothetical protein
MERRWVSVVQIGVTVTLSRQHAPSNPGFEVLWL